MNDVLITAVVPLEGAIIVKGWTSRGRGFCLPVIYTLADGRAVNGYVSSERKKDVLPDLERQKIAIAAGAMKACFNDKGYFGTSTTYAIGIDGLVPKAQEGL